MKWKNVVKKWIALGLALVLCLALAACGSKDSGNSSSSGDSSAAQPPAGGTVGGENTGESVAREVVNVGIEADPGDLSPWGPENTGRTAVANSIYQSLAHIIDGEIVGVLMKDYELAEDESYLDVHLYEYIKDAAGNSMTASDVKFSYDTCVSVGNINGLNFIDRCEVQDEYTARFYFNTVLYVYDLETLFETMYVVTQASYEASSDGMTTHPVSTAAYQVSDYTAGYVLTCTKNENYWQTDDSLINDRDRANVDTINYYILTESTQMSTALQTNTIDMSWAVNNDDLDTIINGGGFWLYQAPDNLVNEVFLNCSDGHATSDVNLRRAIYYAINAEVINQSVYSGNGILCYDTAAPKAPDWQEAWQNEDNYYHYDLDKAKEYLDAWGGNPASLNLVILCSNDTALSNIGQMVGGFLGQLGIPYTMLSVDSANFNTYLYEPTQWDVVVTSKATGNFCTTSWRNCFSASYFSWGGTIGFAFDDELQNLLDTARLLSTHSEETVNAVHQYLVDNAYGYGVVDTVDNYIVTNDCSNVVTSYKGAILPGACTYAG